MTLHSDFGKFTCNSYQKGCQRVQGKQVFTVWFLFNNLNAIFSHENIPVLSIDKDLYMGFSHLPKSRVSDALCSVCQEQGLP